MHQVKHDPLDSTVFIHMPQEFRPHKFPLPLRERARVRGKKPVIFPPHPDPLPQGEREKILIL
jgi:hypothetical protein